MKQAHSTQSRSRGKFPESSHAKEDWLLRRLPGWFSGPLIFGAFCFLFWRERRRPLRHRVEATGERTNRNLLMAGVTALALRVTERPLVSRLSRYVTQRKVGVLKWLSLPVWLEIPLAVVLMDYTLYWWHVLTHRLSWLWRFHVVHHIDKDLDASTAIRFHFGEMVLSVGWRAGQVLLLGISPLPLSLWQTFLLISVLFHHSNVALPLPIERRLVRLMVTPRMHGIHHSTRRHETNSNWSSGLTIWDVLHGTLTLDVPQQSITIGVPAFQNPRDLALPHLFRMPFVPQPPSWPSPESHPNHER